MTLITNKCFPNDNDNDNYLLWKRHRHHKTLIPKCPNPKPAQRPLPQTTGKPKPETPNKHPNPKTDNETAKPSPKVYGLKVQGNSEKRRTAGSISASKVESLSSSLSGTESKDLGQNSGHASQTAATMTTAIRIWRYKRLFQRARSERHLRVLAAACTCKKAAHPSFLSGQPHARSRPPLMPDN